MKKQSVKRSKLICMLISLVASVFLWVYVVTVVSQEKSETIYNIPITFTGVETLREQNLTITEGADATVNLQLTGRRTVVQGLNRDNITLTVDVSKINVPGEFSRNYTITYPDTVQPGSISVDRKIPEDIKIKVESLVTREIPVKVAFQGSMADGYMLESTVPAYDAISITGTEESVANISFALIIVEDQDMTASTTRNMEFTLVDAAGEPVDAAGVELEMDTIGVTVNVVKHKEVPLVMEFTAAGGASEDNVKWKSNPPSITVSGDEKVLDSLNKIVLGKENLSNIVADTTVTYPIVLPDGVKNESGEVEATVTIALNGLSSNNLRVTNFEFINVPAGYVADAVPESLLITVRGPSEDIKTILASDIRVVADLSNISGVAGSFTINDVTIYIDNHPDSGALGTYSVMTTLVSQEELDAQSQETEPGEGTP